MEFLDRFSKEKRSNINLITIRPMGAELFHEDGWTDRYDEVVSFRHFAKAPKNRNTDVPLHEDCNSTVARCV